LDIQKEGSCHAAVALYLFLVVVADTQGLSYYSDPILRQRLRMDGLALAQARMNLIQTDLITWRKPIYQVLSLDGPSHEPGVTQPPGMNATAHISEIVNKFRGGTAMIIYALFARIRHYHVKKALLQSRSARNWNWTLVP
jgi:hypothetical protein